MLQHFDTDDLVRIAIAGGGFETNAAHRSTDELVRIAVAARSGGGVVTFRGLNHLSADELVRIAVAGKGHVFFGDRIPD